MHHFDQRGRVREDTSPEVKHEELEEQDLGKGVTEDGHQQRRKDDHD
jgi:hypothetical protein